jgi:hypothetical protein
MKKESKNDRLRQKKITALNRKIDRALAQLERGEGIPEEQVRAHFRHTRSK